MIFMMYSVAGLRPVKVTQLSILSRVPYISLSDSEIRVLPVMVAKFWSARGRGVTSRGETPCSS